MAIETPALVEIPHNDFLPTDFLRHFPPSLPPSTHHFPLSQLSISSLITTTISFTFFKRLDLAFFTFATTSSITFDSFNHL